VNHLRVPVTLRVIGAGVEQELDVGDNPGQQAKKPELFAQVAPDGLLGLGGGMLGEGQRMVILVLYRSATS
jgi:hypothetical protein